jgi:hypothetical protein
VEGGGNKSCNREAVSERDGEYIIRGGFDCADADKNQRECSDKFREERTKFGHAWMQSNPSRAGNCVCESCALHLARLMQETATGR